MIKYLTSNCDDMAPLNVREATDVKDVKDFFEDRDAIIDDNYVIPRDQVSADSIDVVFANWIDFFISGVSIGKCDLRLMVKIGDKVKCQVHEMSSAEKRKLKKQIGCATNSHIATLVYVGSEKRPKSGA